MTKWADYCVSAKRFAPRTRHIEWLRVHEDLGTKLNDPAVWTRGTVIDAIEKMNKKFITVMRTSENKWKPGAQVRVVVIDGHKFLRTDANWVREDNLDELPEF